MKQKLTTHRLIANKSFYKGVIALALPIILQQGITTFVNMLDNFMVGSYDLLAVSGVGVTNQIFFIVNVLLIAGFSAPGIFVAQFFGAKNNDGVQNAVRFKIWIGTFILLLVSTLLILFGDTFIRTFLTDPEKPEQVEAIFTYAKSYLMWMLIGYLPFSITLLYSSSLRETGETILPLKAGIVAVVVNFVLNFLLINGRLGFPTLGVQGAAIATVIARFIEMLIIVIVSSRNKERYFFLKGLYKTIKLPPWLAKKIFAKGLPLILNEFIWSLGMTVVVTIYAIRGTNILIALNISGTVTNLFFIVFGAMATSMSIIVGQSLGAGKLKEASSLVNKLLVFIVFVCAIVGLFLASISYFIPYLFTSATPDIRNLATSILLVVAGCFPLYSFNAGCVYTLRSGGETTTLFIFDLLFIWGFYLPVAFILIKYTTLPIVIVYLLVQLIELFKSGVMYYFIKKGIWIKNLVLKTE